MEKKKKKEKNKNSILIQTVQKLKVYGKKGLGFWEYGGLSF